MAKTILGVIEKFLEIRYCNRSFAPDNTIFIHLKEKISNRKKKEIIKEMHNCVTERIEFVDP